MKVSVSVPKLFVDSLESKYKTSMNAGNASAARPPARASFRIALILVSRMHDVAELFKV